MTSLYPLSALVSLLLFLASSLLYAQEEWKVEGPWGARLDQMLEVEDGTLYALGDNRLFRLDPGDTVWQRLTAWDATDIRRLFEYRGVLLGFSEWSRNWISFDRGETWQRTEGFKHDGLLHRASTVSIEDSLFYVGPSNNKVLHFSLDSGRTWTPIDTLPQRVTLATDNKRLYAIGRTGGLWRRDYGQWEEIAPTTNTCRSLFLHGDTLVFVVELTAYISGHYRSFNRGEDWDTLAIPSLMAEGIHEGQLWGINPHSGEIHTMALSADSWQTTYRDSTIEISGPCCLVVKGDSLYVGDQAGVALKTPGSDRFRYMSRGLNFMPIIQIATVGDELVVRTSAFFVAEPETRSWRRQPGFPFFTFAVDNEVVYSVVERQLLRSVDLGKSVDTIDTDNIDLGDVRVLHAAGGVILLITRDTIYRSSDGGQSWSNTHAPYGIESLVGRDDVLLARTNRLDTGSTVYSTDRGLTWDTLFDDRIIRNSGSPRGVGVQGTLFAAISLHGILRSRDLGATWVYLFPSDLTSPEEYYIPGMWVFGDTVILSVQSRLNPDDHRLYVSSDAGDTWRRIAYPPEEINLLHLHNGSLYAAADLGIVRTLDVDFTKTGVEPVDTEDRWRMVGEEESSIWSIPPGTSYQLDLYTLSGKHVINLQEQQAIPSGEILTLDTDSLPAGTYLIVLRVDGRSLRSRKVQVGRR